MVLLFSATQLRPNHRETQHKTQTGFSHIIFALPRALSFAFSSLFDVEMYANLCIDLLLDIACFDILFLCLLLKFGFVNQYLFMSLSVVTHRAIIK